MSQLPFNFLLFDAAKAREALKEAFDLNPHYQSLYRGHSEEELEEFAPYLFAIDKQAVMVDWFLKEGWGDSWGILLFAAGTFGEAYKHFRKFLMVQTEDKKQLYFRFYDPRVLRIFLPTCNQAQILEFFGPVKLFICEDQDSEHILLFSHQNGNLITERRKADILLGGAT